MSLVFEMFLYSMFGLGLETMFTAALDYPKKRDRHLMGYSSIWYMPLYAAAPLVFRFLGPRLFPQPWFLRGLAYMVMIYAFEYAGMLALRKLNGASPSEESYYKTRWHVHGLIRLDFAPTWFAAGLLFERLHFTLHPAPWTLLGSLGR